MRVTWGFICALIAVCLAGSAARAADLAVEDLRIPMAAAGSAGLEAVMVRPTTAGRHPLALLSHGSPRNGAHREIMRARGLLPQLAVFAQRGYVAVAVLRRGYGRSGGDWADAFGPCARPDYLKGARAGADDLKAAIAWLRTRPDVDGERILAVGVSAGGFATLALTADPPPGLVGAISFAGGRGSQAADSVCHDERLVDAFRTFGRTSRVPTLWVYARNDHFFGPSLAHRLHEAFIGEGGRADLVLTPAFGEEGHFLFSEPGQTVWLPLVDAFLTRRGLMPKAPRLDVAPLDPPRQLAGSARAAFTTFLAALPHKAFAVSERGGYAWRTARTSTQEAVDEARTRCERESHAPCRIYAIDDRYAAETH